MKQYHYSDGQNQFGPFSFEELKEKKITKETHVWSGELKNWTKAGEVPELSILFKELPPPLIKTPPPLFSTSKPVDPVSPVSSDKRKDGKITKYLIGGFAIIGLALFGIFQKNNSSNYNPPSDNNSANQIEASLPTNSVPAQEPLSAPREKTAEEIRQDLYEKEKRKPKDYLSTSYKLNYKVFSGKDEIKGVIYNSATMATFKDVVLTIKYSTATDTELLREVYTVYDYVYPNSSTNFLIKTYSPKGTKKIGVYIKSATSE